MVSRAPSKISALLPALFKQYNPPKERMSRVKTDWAYQIFWILEIKSIFNVLLPFVGQQNAFLCVLDYTSRYMTCQTRKRVLSG